MMYWQYDVVMAHTNTVHQAPPPAPSRHPSLRLEPIERPPSLLLRLVYKVAGKKLGTVPTGMKVIFPRVPGMLKLTVAMQKFGKKSRLDEDLREFVHMAVSSVNGCTFCMDLGRMMAVTENKSLEKLNAVPDYPTSRMFTARERAAIAYGDEVARNKSPSDETFATLRQHFTDAEIAELTVFIALVHFMNLQQVPLGIGSDGLCAIAQARKR